MYYALLVIHIIVCIVLMVSILLQAGKGGGLAGGAFGGMGGGGSSQLFGSVGAATALTKVTTYTAVFFFLTCIGLWYTARTDEGLPETATERMLQQQATPVPLTQPVTSPAPLPAAIPATPVVVDSAQ